MQSARRPLACLLTRAHTRSSSSSPDVKSSLRTLLRSTAQPVAIVTALLPGGAPHGATLSSFSSIALDPHALVAFSLRVPSRLARALSAGSPLVVNVLSAAQAPLAHRFARADLFPRPFDDAPHTLTPAGVPVLDGVLGALSCTLVSAAWPLHDLPKLDRANQHHALTSDDPWDGEGVASELFIASVTHVERAPPAEAEEDSDPSTLPLLYHRRRYTTTAPTSLPS
jgi:flavin reductase (DIM6/NTAB) family NADH-FMN oxidoreductase RutF